MTPEETIAHLQKELDKARELREALAKELDEARARAESEAQLREAIAKELDEARARAENEARLRQAAENQLVGRWVQAYMHRQRRKKWSCRSYVRLQ